MLGIGKHLQEALLEDFGVNISVASLFLQGAIGLLNQIKKCGCHEEYSWEAQQHQQEIGMSFFFFLS